MNDITNYLGLVHYIARRFLSRAKAVRIDYDDVFQIGCVGLVKAAKRFDEKRGLQFTTYAVPMISFEIMRYFRDNHFIRFPRAEVSQLSRGVKQLSIDQEVPTSDNNQTFADLIVTYDDFTSGIVEDFISFLPDRHQTVVQSKMAGDFQAEIGRKAGISQAQVSRDLAKIRKALSEYMAAI